MPTKKTDDPPLTDAEIAERMERAIKKSFTMPPQPRPAPKPKRKVGKRKK
jgi:hypothetical protein